MIDTVGVTVAGRPMRLRLARPEGFSGPRPALLVLHHKHGLDVFTEACLTRLVQAGYVAAAPDLYHRTPSAAHGTPSYDDKMASLRDEDILADAAAAIAHLKADPTVRRDGIGCFGHCMGGRMSFMLAGAIPDLAAAAVFYSGSMFKAWGNGPTPFERLRDIRCPVIGFFGNDDKNPSPADVDRFDAELTQHGVRHVFHRYDGAAHAFQSFQTPALYRPTQSDDAWSKALAWMAAELKP